MEKPNMDQSAVDKIMEAAIQNKQKKGKIYEKTVMSQVRYWSSEAIRLQLIDGNLMVKNL